MAKMTQEELELKVKSYEANSNPISMRQARLKLLELGLLDDVDLILQADKALSIEWEYSTELKRDNELVIQLGTQLGMSSEQLDDLFIEARKIK